MRREGALSSIGILVAALLMTSCASTDKVTAVAPADPTYYAIESRIDELCSRLEGKRISGPESIKKAVFGKHVNYSLVSVVSVSGKPPQAYRLNYDKDLRIRSFTPEHLNLNTKSFGLDLLKDSSVREALLKAVEDFNRYLNFTYYDGPLIQIIDLSYYYDGPLRQTVGEPYFLVTFYAMPKKDVEKAMKKGRVIYDPFLSFLLTKDMRVFAAFWGA